MTPIIFHHGFMDVLNLRMGNRGIYSFMGIDRLLTQAGRKTSLTRVHPTGSVQRRAEQLKAQVADILTQHPADARALIVAHSMGGLDARCMITQLGMEKKIAALLTISTPHRGTAYADYALRHMARLRIPHLFKILRLDIAAVTDLTIEASTRFNEQNPLHPDVRYFSLSAACQASALPPWSRRAHRIISLAEGPNDGLVSVRSAVFAEHLGTLPFNHWMLLTKHLRPERAHPVIHRYADCIDHILKCLQS